MEPAIRFEELFQNPYLRQKVCDNLSFEEVNQLRIAQNLPNISCQVVINDIDHQINQINEVNDKTKKAVDLITEFGSIYALIFAAGSNDLELISTLIENGANPNVYSKTASANPLIYAIETKSVEALKLLLDSGARPYSRGVNIFRVLKNTRGAQDKQTRYQMLELLLEKGLEIDEVDQNGQSALFRVVLDLDYELVLFLLKNNANPKRIDKNLQTPIVNLYREKPYMSLSETEKKTRTKILRLFSKYLTIPEISVLFKIARQEGDEASAWFISREYNARQPK